MLNTCEGSASFLLNHHHQIFFFEQIQQEGDEKIMEELPQPNGLVKSMRQLIQSEANNNPPATLCTIKKVYDDNKHIDAQLNSGDVLEYLKTIGNPVKDKEGVVIFLDGDTSTPIVIV